jgi:hypothetical protein
VGEPADHSVASHTLAPAAAAPLIRLDDPAGQHRTIRFDQLPDRFQAELV